MELGTNIRNWGHEANRASLRECARLAEAGGLDAIWVNDHLALPERMAEQTQGGAWLEPLDTLAFLAGVTERIDLGVGVLIAPYRPAVLLAKDVASVSVLSEGRLRLGLGVGWLEPEFRAVGVDPRQRGAVFDERLRFLHETLEGDRHEVGGADVVLRPIPPRPRLYIGAQPGESGVPERAFRRAVAHADGWIPSSLGPDEIRAPAAELHQRFADAGKPAPEIVAMKTLPLEDPPAAIALAEAFADAGVTHLVHTGPYDGPRAFGERVNALAGHVLPAVRVR